MESQALIGVEEQQSEGNYDRSRFNAVKHGLTAKTAVLPGEDRELFQSVVEVYKVDLNTQNQVEDDLAESAALAKWQMDRAKAAQSARIDHELLIRKEESSQRDAIAAAGIRSRLFHDRQGPIELYPSKSEYYKGPRTSCSDEPDDPLDPIKLILEAEGTVAGCQMLLREWEALRRNLLSGLSILSHEKLKMLRLMGKQPIQAVGDPEAAQVFLACHALEARDGYAFHELRSEIEADGFKSKKVELKRWDDQGIKPGDPAAARAVLLGIMDAAIGRLRLLERKQQELAETVAKRDEETLREEERKREDQTLRHIDRCSRLLVRSIETIRKGHRDEERGWGRTRRERRQKGGERRAEGGGQEREIAESGNGGRERSGDLVEAWPGYEAEVLELRRKRQRELDALNAPRVPDYARWKPPVVGGEQDGKEGVEDEGSTGTQADVPEAIYGVNGEVFIEGSVTALTLDNQGERENTQNEIGDGAGGELSAPEKCDQGDADDASCVEEACQSRMEGSLTPDLSPRERGFSAGDQTEVNSARHREVLIEGAGTPLTPEDQGERANIQNEIGEGWGEDLSTPEKCHQGDGDDASSTGEPRPTRMEGRLTPAVLPRKREFNAGDQAGSGRPMERLWKRERRRRQSRERRDAGIPVLDEEALDSIKGLLPNSVAVLRDYYGSRKRGDFKRREGRVVATTETQRGPVSMDEVGA